MKNGCHGVDLRVQRPKERVVEEENVCRCLNGRVPVRFGAKSEWADREGQAVVLCCILLSREVAPGAYISES